eukprot:TRINITY_DN928_c0_g1_i13.p3 TRINITY_DN928_c0_g1~~TRINITY_DN928_c0_g1_i13.p3  ORF type:complete len:114 (+),score=43.66 TRINITY_DN928_c0_g1_i13:1-342(+)
MCIIFFFFKQKTAYEISACLVGSEMCIRDRSRDKMKNYVKTLEVENENLRLENEALRKQLIEIEGTVGEESCQENSKIGQSQEEMLKYLYNSVSAYAPQGIITQKKEALQHLL